MHTGSMLSESVAGVHGGAGNRVSAKTELCKRAVCFTRGLMPSRHVFDMKNGLLNFKSGLYGETFSCENRHLFTKSVVRLDIKSSV